MDSLVLLGIVASILGVTIGFKILSLKLANRGFILYRRDLIALTLISIGVLGLFFSVSASQVQASPYVASGQSGYNCQDATNVLCANPGKTGIVLPTGFGLGTWPNMPSAVTELFNNSTIRQVLLPQTDIRVRLDVTCVSPSDNSGAEVRLQEATYSLITDSNSTNFADVPNFPNIPIDNSAGYPCPGTIVSSSGTLPAPADTLHGYIFRVVGQNGGGQGDNPRFSNFQIEVTEQVNIPVTPVLTTSATATNFGVTMVAPFPTTFGYAAKFTWLSDNTTVSQPGYTQVGTSTCTIPAGSPSTCTVTVTFPTSYSGQTPNVLLSSNVFETTRIDVATISLFTTETFNV